MNAMEGFFEYFKGLSAEEQKAGYRVTEASIMCNESTMWSL